MENKRVKKIKVEADSVEEAKKKLKSQIPKGYYVLSEIVSTPRGARTIKGSGETADLAFKNALMGQPPGTRVIEKKELGQPGQKTITIEAYNENGAIAKAKQVIGQPASVRTCKLKSEGKKGFLRIGRKPHLYEVEIFQLAVVEVTINDKAIIWATIGPFTPTEYKRLLSSEIRTKSVNYAHVKRLCWTNPNILEAFFKQDKPVAVVDEEGGFEPTKEEIKLALVAQKHELKGNNSMDTGRFQEAVRHFEKAASISLEDGLLYQNIAAAYQRIGNTYKARAAMREALKREPENPRILRNARAMGVR